MLESGNQVIDLIKDKNVLYIATKDKDYIRVQQEINLLENNSKQFMAIVSEKKSYLSRILFVYKKLLCTSLKEYDVVYISFMAQMIAPFWNWKFHKKTMIVDFFISVYDTLVDDRKKIRDKTFISKILHRIDQSTLNSADYVISDTKTHGKYFAEEFQLPYEKMRTLYLEADVSYYHPMELKRPEKWKDKFIVVYFGSILPVQGVEVILDAINLLKKEKNIHFIMIGPINNKYEKVMSDTVTYIEWLEQRELAKYISYADLCLAGHFSDTVGKANRTIAGKTYIYQAMKKPIVLGDSDANRELFKENESTAFVKRGDSNALAQCIYKKYQGNSPMGEDK